jgi:8-oxo-dGTP pyrophosphatase MutT (NUDIX family)
MSERAFEPLGGKSVFRGRIIEVLVERFRFADGEEAEREIVRHQGAAATVAVDDTHVWLVRQPREAIGDPDVLELPAGRLDKEGEDPLATAARELAEEIGMEAGRWEHLKTYHSSVGFTDEAVHIYLAEELRACEAPDSGENERIETVKWPLDDLDSAIEQTSDAKTIIGLLMLRDRRRR